MLQSNLPSANANFETSRRARYQRAALRRLGRDKPLTQTELRAHLRPRARRFWLTAGGVLIVLGYLLGAPLLSLLALLILCLGIGPEIWYQVSMRGINFTRTFSSRRMRLGETVTVSYQLENRKLLPVPWLEIEDNFPLELEPQRVNLHNSYRSDRQMFITSLSLWLYQRVTRRYRFRAMGRGIWSLGPVYLRTSDPFGFLDNEREVMRQGGQNTLIVLPLVVPLERFGLPASHPFGDIQVRRRLVEDNSQIIGVRDYQPDDSIRRVHWKATARTVALQSKVYPPTTTYTLALFLNINTSPNPSMGINPPLLELAICAAASVASWASTHRFATGLFTNGLPGTGEDDEIGSFEQARAFMRVPPSTHPDQIVRVLEVLARIQPYFGVGMGTMIAREQTKLPMGTTIVVISAAAGLRPEEVTLLTRLKQRGHNVTLLLTGEEGPDTGSLTVYRLGGEQTWHDLFATRMGDDPDHHATLEIVPERRSMVSN